MVRRATLFLAKGIILSLCVVLGVLVGTTVREVPAGASGGGAARVMNGDCDGDGKRGLTDVIYLLRYIFVPESPPPVACADGTGLTPEQAEILSHMRIVDIPTETHPETGAALGTAKTIRFTGVNVQVVNGLGATNGHPDDPDETDPAVTSVNGLGNLIVGYQEVRSKLAIYNDLRTGSHNVVVGMQHNYSSYGGLAVGSFNTISAAGASVSGGYRNTASGRWASVCGGEANTAGGDYASVSGGENNGASGHWASISGNCGLFITTTCGFAP